MSVLKAEEHLMHACISFHDTGDQACWLTKACGVFCFISWLAMALRCHLSRLHVFYVILLWDTLAAGVPYV